MDYEFEKIRLQKKVVQEQLDALNEAEKEILSHLKDAKLINTDLLEKSLESGNVDPGTINYIMGQSSGFVNGFRAAIGTIVSSLANGYRDIRITEDELYVLTDLGAESERAWLKDRKQSDVLEKAGWKYNLANHSWGRPQEGGKDGDKKSSRDPEKDAGT